MNHGKEKYVLTNIYRKMYTRFGPQHWWPGETPFEVIIGAILTQNTNWQNVEKAIRNLKKSYLLTPKAIRDVSSNRLARLIRPAGYYNIKSLRLKEFIGFLYSKYSGSVELMFKTGTDSLRDELLDIKGIGPETADSILLYAGQRPVFVIDTYSKRILQRHGIVRKDIRYGDLQALFTRNLPRHKKLFNEYHALLVRTGKEYCRTKPKCDNCPLKKI